MSSRRVLQGVWKRLPAVLGGLCLILAVVRLLLRDRVPVLSAAYYATPPVVLMLMALGVGCLAGLQKKWRWTIASLPAALVFLGWHILASYRFNEPAVQDPAAAPFRVVCWNVAQGARGWERVWNELRSAEADLIGLVEGGRPRPESEKKWKEAFPEYDILFAKGGFVVLARGKLTLVEGERWDEGGRFVRVRLAREEGSWDVVLVDLTPNPLVRRRPLLERLRKVIEPLSAGPLVVLGDFNTPRSSAFFDPWEGTLVHAFDAAGRGFSETWPSPVPVLDLDHVWCGRKVRVLSCRLEGTWASDHRKVITELLQTE